MSTKLRQRVVVLTGRRRRRSYPLQVGNQAGQRHITNFRTKRRHPPVRSERKKEVFAALDYVREHILSQRIAGIEEDVIGRETIKLEGKVDHLIRGGAEHRMAEIKAVGGHLGGDRLRGPKRP